MKIKHISLIAVLIASLSASADMTEVPDIARPDLRWDGEFHDRISTMWQQYVPGYDVNPWDGNADCGKRHWPALLTKLAFARDFNIGKVDEWIAVGADMLKGPCTGTFFKPFSCSGYAMYYFNWHDEIMSLDPAQIDYAQGKINNEWHFLMRGDHLLDACCGYNDKGGKEFNSENFQWMLKVAGYLFAHEFHGKEIGGEMVDMTAKDIPGFEVRTGLADPRVIKIDAKGVNVIRYFDESIKNLTRTLFNAGRVEWNSNNYYGHTLSPLLTLYQCADKCGDPEGDVMKLRARACLDWMLTEAAIHYRDGFQVAADARAKVSAFTPFAGSTYQYTIPYFADFKHYPSFGQDVWKGRDAGFIELGYLASSSYRPAQVILEIANKEFDMPVEIQSAKPFYHIDRGEYILADGTVNGTPAYSSWNGQGDGRRFEFETIYIGKNFTMSSAAIGRPVGFIGTYSELGPWRIGVDGVDEGCVMLAGNGGQMSSTNGRDAWHQIGQYRNMMMQIVKNVNNNRIWLLVPDLNKKLTTTGSGDLGQNRTFKWVGDRLFIDMGHEVYIALIPSTGVTTTFNPYYRESNKHTMVEFIWNELEMGSLVTEIGDADSYGSFDKFVEALSSKNVEVNGDVAEYQNGLGNSIKMEFVEPAEFAMISFTADTPAGNPIPHAGSYPKVWGDGKYIDFASWDSYRTVYGTPIINQRWGSGELTLCSRNHLARININPETAKPTYYEGDPAGVETIYADDSISESMSFDPTNSTLHVYGPEPSRLSIYTLAGSTVMSTPLSASAKSGDSYHWQVSLADLHSDIYIARFANQSLKVYIK